MLSTLAAAAATNNVTNNTKVGESGSGGKQVVRDFMQAMEEAPAGTSGVVFDVGANDGQWSYAMRTRIDGLRKEGKDIDLSMFEPQKIFAKRLTRIAKMGATYVPAAAWKSDGNATIQFANAGSTSATITTDTFSGRDTFTLNQTEQQTVEEIKTIDLAAYINRALDAHRIGTTVDPPSLMKLDVEGAEYELLPWLLAQGALCRLRFIQIEWHLNARAPHERIAAVGLRISLHSLLNAACATPPLLIEHDEYFDANAGVPVPGIQFLAERHSCNAHKRVKQYYDSDDAYLRAAAPIESCPKRPSCRGKFTDLFSCSLEDMACSFNKTRDAYRKINCSYVVAYRGTKPVKKLLQ